MVFRCHFTTMRSDTRSMTVSRPVFINAELNWREQANALIDIGLGSDLRISPHKRASRKPVVADDKPTCRYLSLSGSALAISHRPIHPDRGNPL